jgi:hypothetical protein
VYITIFQVDITMDKFANHGLCFFGWDLSADKSPFSACKQIQQLAIEFEFAEVTPKDGIVAVLYAVFPSTIEQEGDTRVTVYPYIR